MSRGVDFPSIDPSVSRETLTFDFGRVMPSSAAVIAAEITCEATLGVDQNPSARPFGGIVIFASPATKQNNAAVMQMVGNLVAGEVYRMSCTAHVSDGQVLHLWSLLPCVRPS
jgi:hypothetical protein